MEQRVGTRETSDRTGGLAQPGLKATLQALGAKVLYPTNRPQGDLGTPALQLQPLAGLYCHGTVADFLSELSDQVTSGSICFFINVSTKT